MGWREDWDALKSNQTQGSWRDDHIRIKAMGGIPDTRSMVPNESLPDASVKYIEGDWSNGRFIPETKPEQPGILSRFDEIGTPVKAKQEIPKKDWQAWRYQDIKIPSLREYTEGAAPQNRNSRDMKLTVPPTPDKERKHPAFNDTNEPWVQASLDRAPEGNRIQNTESPYWHLPEGQQKLVDDVVKGAGDIETKRTIIKKRFGFDYYAQPPYNLHGTTAGMTGALVENMFSRVGTLPPAEKANEYAVMGAGLAGSLVPAALVAGVTAPLGPVAQGAISGAGANLAATPGNADREEITKQALLGALAGGFGGYALTKGKPKPPSTANIDATPTQVSMPRMQPEVSPKMQVQMNRGVSEISPTVPKTEPVARKPYTITKQQAELRDAAVADARSIINNPDIVGKQRTDMIAYRRDLVQFAESPAARDMRLDYRNGTKVAKFDINPFNGASPERGFEWYIELDGPYAGRIGQDRTALQTASDIARDKKVWAEQQEGFTKIRESGQSDQMPNKPPIASVQGGNKVYVKGVGNMNVNLPTYKSGNRVFLVSEKNRPTLEMLKRDIERNTGWMPGVEIKRDISGSAQKGWAVGEDVIGYANESKAKLNAPYLYNKGHSFDELGKVVQKAIDGKPLTERQHTMLRGVLQDMTAFKRQLTKPEAGATTGELGLKVGDEVRLEGDWHRVIKHEDGQLTLKDGRVFKVDDTFEALPVDKRVSGNPVVARDVPPTETNVQKIVSTDNPIGVVQKRRATPEELGVKVEQPIERAPEPIVEPPKIETPPPVKPPEVTKPMETPEPTKPSALSIRVEAEAIEAKLTQDFGDLPEYRTMNMKEQAAQAKSVLDADYELAKRMAMGTEKPPEGLREASIYEAVKIRALKERDVETLQRLATESTIPTKLSEYGQAIKAADSELFSDPVRVMQDIGKVRMERSQRIGRKVDAEEITRLRSELESAQKALAERISKKSSATYGTRNRIVTRDAYESSKKALLELTGKLYANPIDPIALGHITKIGTYHLEAGARVFSEWSAKMAQELGEGIKPHLEDIWKKIHDDKRVDTYLRTQKTRLRNETEKFGQKLDTGDFGKAEKRSLSLDPEGMKLKWLRDRAKENYNSALSASKSVTKEEATKIVDLSQKMIEAKAALDAGGDRFAYGSARVVYENYVNDLKNGISVKTAIQQRAQQFNTTLKSNPAKAVFDLGADAIQGVANNSVAMVATLDNSFLGRQGLKTLMTHPTVWAKGAGKSFSDFVKTLGGKNAHDALMADVYSRPNYLNGDYQKAGILAKVEEQYPTSLPEKIPGVGRVFKASEYAFTGSAIRMRTGLYDLLAERAKANGVNMSDPVQIKALGKLINSLTARGQWGKTGEPAVVRMVLWAPKMLKGNIDVLTAHGAGMGLESSFARKQAAINLFKIVTETATVMAIANALKPGSAELDPRSSDFGKIKVGNTRFDITGGSASIVTLAARLSTNSRKTTSTGEVVPYSTGFGKQSSFDALVDFLVNKTNPPARVAVDLLRGENFKGEPFSWKQSLYGASTPIIVKQAIELKDDQSPERLAGLILDGLGIGSNTYEPKPKAVMAKKPPKKLSDD